MTLYRTYTEEEAKRMEAEGYVMREATCLSDSERKYIIAELPRRWEVDPPMYGWGGDY